MDLKLLSAIGAAGAAGSGEKIGVEDVFKTYAYRGNTTARSINTDIDLSSSEDGIIWIKKLTGSTGSNVSDHMLFTKTFYSAADNLYFYNSPNLASSWNYGSNGFSAFNNNGFSIGSGTRENANGEDYISWTFKKKEKFLDIVTWSKSGSDGTSARTLSHNLGSVPGFIMLKAYTSSTDWICWHRGLSTNQYWKLNSNGAVSTDTHLSVNSVSASEFVVGKDNDKVGSYIAFIFAHEEAEFGPDGTQSIISCGTYNGSGSAGDNKISLPFEPGWLLTKQIESDPDPNMGRPMIQDNIRGWTARGTDSDSGGRDRAVEVDVDHNQWSWPTSDPLPDGYLLQTGGASGINVSGKSYMYVAIAAETGRTMKAIETASDVFAMDVGNGSTTIPSIDSGFPVDMALWRSPGSTSDWKIGSRLTKNGQWYTNTNGTMASANGAEVTFHSNEGFLSASWASTGLQGWMWKRHAGFDCVVYKGTGSAQSISHNLGPDLVPEMIWIKTRTNSQSWAVYHKGLNGGTNPEQYYLMLNSNSEEQAATSRFNDTAPTSSVFTVGDSTNTGNSGDYYSAFLFSSVKGVSHCGYYDGSNSEQTITIPDGGFQPRFVIIKSSTASEGWVVLDTLRGWGAGDDEALRLDIDSGQGADPYGAPTSTGFTLVGNWNVVNQSGKKYIYYAHA